MTMTSGTPTRSLRYSWPVGAVTAAPGSPNSRAHHFPAAALRKCEVLAVSVGCGLELAWMALARSNRACSVNTMPGWRTQQSIGHTFTHCGVLKKPTHSVQESLSITYTTLPLVMPLFGHTGTQAAQLIQPSVIVNGIARSPYLRPPDRLQLRQGDRRANPERYDAL